MSENENTLAFNILKKNHKYGAPISMVPIANIGTEPYIYKLVWCTDSKRISSLVHAATDKIISSKEELLCAES